MCIEGTSNFGLRKTILSEMKMTSKIASFSFQKNKGGLDIVKKYARRSLIFPISVKEEMRALLTLRGERLVTQETISFLLTTLNTVLTLERYYVSNMNCQIETISEAIYFCKRNSVVTLFHYKISTVENKQRWLLVALDLLKITELQENSKAFFFQLNSSRTFNEILEQIAVNYVISMLNYKK